MDIIINFGDVNVNSVCGSSGGASIFWLRYIRNLKIVCKYFKFCIVKKFKFAISSRQIVFCVLGRKL